MQLVPVSFAVMHPGPVIADPGGRFGPAHPGHNLALRPGHVGPD